MRFWRIVFIIILSLLLQGTLCPVIRFDAVSPNLVLIVVVFIGTNLGISKGGVVGALTGILVDVLSGETIVPYATTYLLCGALAGILAKKMYQQHWLSALLFTFIGTLVEGIIIGLWSGHGEFIPLVKYIVLPAIVYNALVCVLLSQVMEYFLQPHFTRPTGYEI